MFYVIHKKGHPILDFEIKETENQVLDYIQGRMAFNREDVYENYTVIEGVERKIEVVKEIRLSQ